MKFRNKNTGEIVEWDCTKINSSLVSAQNRERLYWANFPITQPEDKGILLKDIIEPNVEDKYLGGYNPTYKSQSNSLHNLNGKSNVICAGTHGYALGYIPVTPVRVGTASDVAGHDYNKRIYSVEGKSPTLNAGSGGNLEPKIAIVPEATKKGYVEIEDGMGVDLTFPTSKTRRGRKMDKKSNALLTGVEFYWYENQTYRKLTPLECERLQTVEDNWTSMVSNTQRYKMLGNGWTIDVIAHILTQSGISSYQQQNHSTLPPLLP